jgi:pSer/pThr/pTyr-binding forkhead associated (FHA) protein
VIQIRPGEVAFDPAHYLILKGVAGPGEGESVKVSLGETVTVGRSRRCEWSLKKTPRFLMDVGGERERIRSSLAYRTVSRRHCRVAYVSPDVVEVTDLSTNGTTVDGRRVDRILLGDVRRRSHEIRLGVRGNVLVLACGSVEFVA